jgi:hypothetical protein
VHGHDSVDAVNLHNRDEHFNGQQQSRAPHKESEDQKQTSKRFQYRGDIDQLSRQAVLHKHGLHPAAGVSELGKAVRKEDYAESRAEEQQAKRLERIQKFQTNLR